MFNKNIFLKSLVSMVLILSACSQTPNTLPVNTNNPIKTDSSVTPSPNTSSQPLVNNSSEPVVPIIKSVSDRYYISKKNPQWSPDGKKVVFSRGYKIYTADANGTNNLLLIDLKKDIPNPSLGSPLMSLWSPKGDKIALMVRQAFSNNELYIMNTDGSNVYRNKEIHYSGQLHWFPNGDKLLFSAKNGLATINSDGTDLNYLKNEDVDNIQLQGLEQIEISPDGSKMFINSGYDELFTYDFQTRKKKTIFKRSEIRETNQFLSWSPDSKFLLFQRLSDQGETDIYKINIEDLNLLKLSQGGEFVTAPQWSPDGKKIAYGIGVSDSSSNKYQLKIVNIDGSFINSIEIPSIPNAYNYIQDASWSPDSNKLVLNTNTATYIVDTISNSVNKVVDYTQLFIQWSPDNSKIFYADPKNEPLVSDFNNKNQINLFIRPINPIVKEFNLKSPEQSEIDNLSKSKIIEANSKFSLKILNQLANEKPNTNLFISPLSMSLALSMTYNGAESKTKDQMMQALEYNNLSLETINKDNNTLLRMLLSDQDIELSIANAIFSNQKVKFNADFLNRNRESYYSEIKELDFSNPNALTIINDWVDNKTNGRIPSILDKIEPGDILFLINAIYFKGTWTNVFEKSQTKEMSFKLIDGTVKNHPMMNQSGSYKHYKDENVEFVRMPYGNSQRTGMYIFLPKEGISLEEFRKNLKYENIDKWFSRISNERGNITIPKFKMNYEADLIPALENLGMTDAFQSNKANFSKMTNLGGVYLSKALQKTFVEVNEEGTEAAAVTIIGASATSVPPPPFNFVVDRPFMTAIVDEKTKTILFMGLIFNPQ